MPCSDGGPDWGDYQRRVDAATRAACEAIQMLENTPMFPTLSLQTRAWWEAHQESDRRRRAQEATFEAQKKAKADALAKLTQAERDALGIWR